MIPDENDVRIWKRDAIDIGLLILGVIIGAVGMYTCTACSSPQKPEEPPWTETVTKADAGHDARADMPDPCTTPEPPATCYPPPRGGSSGAPPPRPQ